MPRKIQNILPVLGIFSFILLLGLHFGRYGNQWAFVEGHPQLLIDAEGFYLDGSPANPLDLALVRNGHDRVILWFNTITLSGLLLAFIFALIYDCRNAFQARLASRRKTHALDNRRRFHHP